MELWHKTNIITNALDAHPERLTVIAIFNMWSTVNGLRQVLKHLIASGAPPVKECFELNSPAPNGLPAKCAFQLCFPLCLKLSISYSLPVLLVRCLFRRLSMSVGRFLVSRSYCSVLDFRSPVLSVANTRWPSTLVMSIRFE